MTATELADTLTTIANQTKSLRDAGVVGRVEIVGVAIFEIGEALAQAAPTQAAAPQNPIDDPDTYGGYIPQRRVIVEPRPTVEAEDEE